MNKKYYTFLILIFLLLFLLYNIISHRYKQYKISEHIKTISALNIEIENNIKKAQEIIKYKKSESYKNRILKEDNLKNKWELVIYLTSEDEYNTYVKPIKNKPEIDKSKIKISDETYSMSIYQKWIWFLFKKDLR